MTKLLATILMLLARCYQWRFRPDIVAITGNAGKTTTKEAIAAVLATRYRVRASAGNLNNELGVPLTILGDFAGEYYRTGGTAWFWLTVILRAKLGFFASRSRYPEVLVLEYGADRPGDIRALVHRYPPHVSVITQIGAVPVHVEFFASPEHLAQEKMQMIAHLESTDYAVLNYDDLTVLEMRGKTKAQVHTFGFGDGADVQVLNFRERTDGTLPLGIGFDIADERQIMAAAINGSVGRGLATAAAAAIAVGRVFGIGLAEAVQVLAQLRPPPGRLHILRGVKDTVILDDTYNASPAATHLALETAHHLPAQRRVIVLGDMLELGEHGVQAHQAVGNLAGEIAGVLVCVGQRARFIADAAANQMPKERIQWFEDSIAAASAVQQLLKPGDLVLVKGSQGMRMERIVKEIMAEPERANELLVRQNARWLAK